MSTEKYRAIALDIEKMDPEKQSPALGAFVNDSLHNISWQSVQATAGSREVLVDAAGQVEAGELLAIMGPSGCGKTTLLMILAQRQFPSKFHVEGEVALNGFKPSHSVFRKISAFVEQEDNLLGALTVRETLDFAARLSLPSAVTKAQRHARVDALLKAFGLTDQADILVGTPIRKGISGGQKRRLSIASQLITAPAIIFLDEPTSGLDSQASLEVISYLRRLAKETRMIIVASIHQPSNAVFNTFDKLMLLSRGHTAFFGSVVDVGPYFDGMGMSFPVHANPAETLMDLLNTDFAVDAEAADKKLDGVLSSWQNHERSPDTSSGNSSGSTLTPVVVDGSARANPLLLPVTLMHRSLIKSYRDVVVYGIRIAMYMGLAIMMGTVWLRLKPNQDSIQSFINGLFFGGAFLSFMAVAYVPAYLEDRALFIKERANGLYGATSFMVANFAVGLPYLFIIVLLFSVISYWLSGYRPNADAFFTWIMWLYLDLIAAESLVVLISSLVPTFVVALAATAFANGLRMCVGGFLVPPNILNVFWRYVFHYIDYQAYVFQGMMVNEFESRSFECGAGCHCMYSSELEDQCKIGGTAVLRSYGYHTGKTGEWVGILIAIIVVYRLLGWAVLWVKKT